MEPRESGPGAETVGSVKVHAYALLLITLIAVFVCLTPKPENDLFFELRIGTDILHTGRLPHFDTYSWTNYGTRWDVPEWLSFIVYAEAFRVGGFLGTWLVMVSLAVGTAWCVWFGLARRVGPLWAFTLTALMLLALNDCLQERPYAFTYLLLAITLRVLITARDGQPTRLFWLPPLCALWTNLHQGIVVLIGLLLVYAVGDAAAAVWLGWRDASAEKPDLLAVSPDEWGRGDEEKADARHQQWVSAGRMLAAAAACAIAAMVSPYGWRVYWNIFITLRDRHLMANVTEWNSAATLAFPQLQPFLALTVLAFAFLCFSRRRSLGDLLAVTALLIEAWIHARNIALFAVGSVLLAGPHLTSAVPEMRRRMGLAPKAVISPRWLPILALLFTLTVGLASFVRLHRVLGPQGGRLAGIGEAVAEAPSYPENACRFLETLPPHLRLLNDFEIGGYLMWRLPRQPVFVDGRLDVYVGRTFDAMLILAQSHDSPARQALLKGYDFNCVITRRRGVAALFAADPNWKRVYADPEGAGGPHCQIFLRQRPTSSPALSPATFAHRQPG